MMCNSSPVIVAEEVSSNPMTINFNKEKKAIELVYNYSDIKFTLDITETDVRIPEDFKLEIFYNLLCDINNNKDDKTNIDIRLEDNKCYTRFIMKDKYTGKIDYDFPFLLEAYSDSDIMKTNVLKLEKENEELRKMNEQNTKDIIELKGIIDKLSEKVDKINNKKTLSDYNMRNISFPGKIMYNLDKVLEKSNKNYYNIETRINEILSYNVTSDTIEIYEMMNSYDFDDLFKHCYDYIISKSDECIDGDYFRGYCDYLKFNPIMVDNIVLIVDKPLTLTLNIEYDKLSLIDRNGIKHTYIKKTNYEAIEERKEFNAGVNDTIAVSNLALLINSKFGHNGSIKAKSDKNILYLE